MSNPEEDRSCSLVKYHFQLSIDVSVIHSDSIGQLQEGFLQKWIEYTYSTLVLK